MKDIYLYHYKLMVTYFNWVSTLPGSSLVHLVSIMIISKLFHSLKTSVPFFSIRHQHTPTHILTIRTHIHSYIYCP